MPAPSKDKVFCLWAAGWEERERERETPEKRKEEKERQTDRETESAPSLLGRHRISWWVAESVCVGTDLREGGGFPSSPAGDGFLHTSHLGAMSSSAGPERSVASAAPQRCTLVLRSLYRASLGRGRRPAAPPSYPAQTQLHALLDSPGN